MQHGGQIVPGTKTRPFTHTKQLLYHGAAGPPPNLLLRHIMAQWTCARALVWDAQLIHALLMVARGAKRMGTGRACVVTALPLPDNTNLCSKS